MRLHMLGSGVSLVEKVDKTGLSKFVAIWHMQVRAGKHEREMQAMIAHMKSQLEANLTNNMGFAEKHGQMQNSKLLHEACRGWKQQAAECKWRREVKNHTARDIGSLCTTELKMAFGIWRLMTRLLGVLSASENRVNHEYERRCLQLKRLAMRTWIRHHRRNRRKVAKKGEVDNTGRALSTGLP